MADAPSIDRQIACLKREIALRKNVYPKWVSSGRMKQAEADAQIEDMTAALHTLMDVKERQQQDVATAGAVADVVRAKAGPG